MKKILFLLFTCGVFCAVTHCSSIIAHSQSGWSLVYTANDALHSVHFVNANTGYAAGGTGINSRLLIKTTDGGLSWTTPISGSGRTFTSVQFINDNTGYLVGADKY